MEVINRWLNGKRNYVVGVVIFSVISNDWKLTKFFHGEPSPLKERELLKAIKSLSSKKVLRDKVSREVDEMPESADPVVRSLLNEWKPIYQRMQYLRGQLDRWEGNSKEDISLREPIAREILELEQRCIAIWERRRHYLETGKLPTVKQDEDPIPADPKKLKKLIESTERNIRRNRQLSEQHPDKAEYPLRVKKYEEQLDRIMKSIGNEQGSSEKK